MKPTTQDCKYDAVSRAVVDADGQTVICNVALTQDAAVGELIAKAPKMASALEKMPAVVEDMTATIARLSARAQQSPTVAGQVVATAPAMAAIALDLHNLLDASLSAWLGEEDSVKKKHGDLINNLEAAHSRTGVVLGASGALPADALRALAHTLLERAHQIDGLQPYVIKHAHRFGDTMYTTWSATPPTDAQLANMIGEGFEPDRDRGETLEHHRLEIAELTGSSPSSRLGTNSGEEDHTDGESNDEALRPSGM